MLVDDPQAYVALDRRRALATGSELPDHVVGAALFVDISGFTPLTEALVSELGPREGADALTAVLDAVSGELIGTLHSWRADVIYFSGDALTCWIDGDDGRAAVSCAVALQELMRTAGAQTTPSGRELRLGVKVAVAAGRARRFVVGNPRVQLIEVLAGSLMDRLAQAEQSCEVGDVVVDFATAAALRDTVITEAAGDAGARRVLSLSGPQASAPGALPLPADLPEDEVRRWLLPSVYERMRAGDGEFLAELRPAVPLFLSFTGIDFDGDAQAPAQLDEFIRRAQRVIDSFGGSTLQLTLGDKGAYLYAVFGAPEGHEDDDARACAAALDLLALEGATRARDIAIGIARGRLRSGTYGHRDRRTFCCLGDAVNLAARLMGRAGPGQVRVAEAVRVRTGQSFSWTELGPIAVKGKTEPVGSSLLRGRRPRVIGAAGEGAARLSRRHDGALAGRRAELADLQGRLHEAIAGRGAVVTLAGDPGVGCSRLLAELVRRAPEAAGVHVGEAASLEGTGSYAVWREVWRELLIPVGATSAREAAALLPRLLADLAPGLARRTPLLAPVLDLPLPENSVTEPMEPQLRKAAREDMLEQLLAALSSRRPLLIVLDDSHAHDDLSRDLLAALATSISAMPVLIVVAGRASSVAEPDMRLEPLAEADTATLVAEREPALKESAVLAAVRRAEGNALFASELAGFLAAGNRMSSASEDGGVTTDELPETLSSLVLTRIDRLGESPRRALKAGGVIGREFDTDELGDLLPDLTEPPGLDAHLADLERAQLTSAEGIAASGAARHGFRQLLVRDVAYESIPGPLRATLHERAGDRERALLDASGEPPSDRVLELLAYHHGRCRDDDKRRVALLDAAVAARARYANRAAIRHYSDALSLLEGSQLDEARLALGQVKALTGDLDGAAAVYADALVSTRTRGDVVTEAWALTHTGEVARRQARFDDAEADLRAAATAFATADDAAGQGRVLHLRGTLAAQQGDLAAARERYQASLALRERTGDVAGQAAILSNLAIVAEYEGDHTEQQRLNEQALALREETGDRWAIGVSLCNLGMTLLLQQRPKEAQARLEEALAIYEDVGDPWMRAITQNNYANAARDVGDLDAALAAYAPALQAYDRAGDAWAIAILADDAALALLRLAPERRRDALMLLGISDALREQIGSPRTAAQDSEVAALTGAATDADRRRGHDTPAGDRVRLVRACLQPSSSASVEDSHRPEHADACPDQRGRS